MARRDRSLARTAGSIALNDPQEAAASLSGFGTVQEGDTVGHGVLVVRLTTTFTPSDSGGGQVIAYWGVYLGAEGDGNPMSPGASPVTGWFTHGVLSAGLTIELESDAVHGYDGDRTEWHGQRTAAAGDDLWLGVTTLVADDQPYSIEYSAAVLFFTGTAS